MKNLKFIIKIAIFTLLIFMNTGLTFSQEKSNRTVKIAKNVYSFTSNNGYYSMFIITEDGVIVIESVSTKHSKEMVREIKKITNKPIKYLLHSHNHWDHSSGGQVFLDIGATTLAHIEAYKWMKANPGRDMAIPKEYWNGNKKEITLGNSTIELHYLGMNHGLGMTVFILPKHKLAYIADLVTPNRVLPMIVPDFNIKEWEKSLKELLKMDFNKAIYSHNEKTNGLAIYGGDKKDIKLLSRFIKDIRAGIYNELKKGTPPFEIPNILKLPKYKHWNKYDEWLALNVWRILLDEWMGPFPWKANN
ncbi:MBL fold metallo-hydrolase [uncultured Tenacibaculum sp.]|uniref:MBL fold metallo-hydrolase n=1 Tax=uncultured Tenacibaculum sp. TaxID=174713 RepID=UPI0026386269|nr:MBL fold metallo-hydrolase [uncultured Tenacibaculum sp.]